ncbi:response regulator [Larkinella soli]|uniref:response regulator n=1 Tax=Larkinella soli TaxID=1770527 RepID=UPI000FFBDBE7|nr:response regulator [Larkinella soli]
MNRRLEHSNTAGIKLALLIIEDNEEQWLLMQAALKNASPELTLTWAASQAQALTYLQQQQALGYLPDLILLDLYLPERQTGLDLLQTIKSSSYPLPLLPVIVFSQSAQKQDIQACYWQGANSYITKPLRAQEWADCLTILLEFWGRTASRVPTRYLN